MKIWRVKFKIKGSNAVASYTIECYKHEIKLVIKEAFKLGHGQLIILNIERVYD
jgi:aromatic ring-opening dioxygenase catalytic subunit (LigB family)